MTRIEARPIIGFTCPPSNEPSEQLLSSELTIIVSSWSEGEKLQQRCPKLVSNDPPSDHKNTIIVNTEDSSCSDKLL